LPFKGIAYDVIIKKTEEAIYSLSPRERVRVRGSLTPLPNYLFGVRIPPY
jgi:hypothetical protein